MLSDILLTPARLLVLTLLVSITATSAVTADDWTAVKLRGVVLALQDGQWVRLERGDVISDERLIKTLSNGRVELVRGEESIALAGNTLINIQDRNGERFTIVQQHQGSVSVKAEKRNVQHFAVVTPYLAAVVKGTQFEVAVGAGSADVSVTRGEVHVADPSTGNNVDVTAGQSASLDAVGGLTVAGRGELAVIHTANGQPLKPTWNGKSAEKSNDRGDGSQGHAGDNPGHGGKDDNPGQGGRDDNPGQDRSDNSGHGSESSGGKGK